MNSNMTQPDIKLPIILWCLIAIISINLAWAHQTILIKMVDIINYYNFNVEPPFSYRILPAIIYRAIFFGNGEIKLGLNEPLSSSYQVFQLILDSVSLFVLAYVMYLIARHVNTTIRPRVIFVFSTSIFLMIVVFGYFMVPNRALFYPYDFTELALTAIIIYLCSRRSDRDIIFFPLVIFFSSMNKETAIFFLGLYIVLRLDYSTNKARTIFIVLASLVAAIIARIIAIKLSRPFDGYEFSIQHQYIIQLPYTMQQLTNPILLFAMTGIFSYLYFPIIILRKNLNKTDTMIVVMVLLWFIIMVTVGIIRELRIFAPASLLLFFIISRRLPVFLEKI